MKPPNKLEKSVNNPDEKCMGCHMKIEEDYYFCSITCACLCGYMHVRGDGKKKNIKELKNPKIRAKFLNNPPLRERPTNKDYL